MATHEPASRIAGAKLHSARLLLRPVTAGDLQPLAHVAQTTDNARIDAMIRNSRDCWQRHGYGMWVIVPEREGSLIGWCGLRSIQTPGEPELLYGVAEPARGQGFAAEAARAVVEFALGLPDVSGVWAATTPDHLASIRVMERSGMSFDCRAHLDGVDSVIYRLRKVATKPR
jgi:RimJ/RimL family protein N-acetyltransferase